MKKIILSLMVLLIGLLSVGSASALYSCVCDGIPLDLVLPCSNYAGCVPAGNGGGGGGTPEFTTIGLIATVAVVGGGAAWVIKKKKK